MMAQPVPEETTWRFVQFGLIVTGKGEEAFLPMLFRALMESGHCSFKVIRRIGQRSAIISEKRKLKMVGTGKTIPDRDVDEIGLPARRCLAPEDSFVILVDDLEDRNCRQVFDRYRDVLDRILGEPLCLRASVHFLVKMLEAYYFADANAVNSALGTSLSHYEGDVETIPNPKQDLKKLKSGVDEIADGREIVARLDLPRILSNPATCASLRTLVAWCIAAIGEPDTRFCIADGVYEPVTRTQIDDFERLR